MKQYPSHTNMELLPSYNRQFLQEYKKFCQYHGRVSGLCSKIMQEAARGSTTHVYPLNEILHPQMKKQESDELVDWIMKMLQNKFPEVTITHKEATDLRGNVERGIIIDWS